MVLTWERGQPQYSCCINDASSSHHVTLHVASALMMHGGLFGGGEWRMLLWPSGGVTPCTCCFFRRYRRFEGVYCCHLRNPFFGAELTEYMANLETLNTCKLLSCWCAVSEWTKSVYGWPVAILCCVVQKLSGRCWRFPTLKCTNGYSVCSIQRRRKTCIIETFCISVS